VQKKPESSDHPSADRATRDVGTSPMLSAPSVAAAGCSEPPGEHEVSALAAAARCATGGFDGPASRPPAATAGVAGAPSSPPRSGAGAVCGGGRMRSEPRARTTAKAAAIVRSKPGTRPGTPECSL